MAAMESVVVTGSRVMQAEQEDLGDVKLYRIPEPVTVAARSQKQVALLDRENVQVAFVYRQNFSAGDRFENDPASRYMVTRNRAAEGLGLPLPAGGLVLFEQRDGRPILIGEGALGDRAIGDDVEIRLNAASGVRSSLRQIARFSDSSGEFELVVTNDRAQPVRYEASLQIDGVRFVPRGTLARRDGRPLWAVTIPANGQATLNYRLLSANR